MLKAVYEHFGISININRVSTAVKQNSFTAYLKILRRFHHAIYYIELYTGNAIFRPNFNAHKIIDVAYRRLINKEKRLIDKRTS